MFQACFGSPPSWLRTFFGVDEFPRKEKDKKFVDGNTPLSHLGNLEEEKSYSL